jgi:hypothetical protein
MYRRRFLWQIANMRAALICSGILAFVLTSFSSCLWADEMKADEKKADEKIAAALGGSVDQSAVIVDVRTIKASGPTRAARQSHPIEIDARLQDLKVQLSKLQYRQFSLINAHQQRIPFRMKGTIELSGGQSLTVRPLYYDNKRIGMWLKWIDGHGSELLDTRMHFDCNEPMIAGTESEGESGIILAIGVRRARVNDELVLEKDRVQTQAQPVSGGAVPGAHN